MMSLNPFPFSLAPKSDLAVITCGRVKSAPLPFLTNLRYVSGFLPDKNEFDWTVVNRRTGEIVWSEKETTFNLAADKETQIVPLGQDNRIMILRNCERLEETPEIDTIEISVWETPRQTWHRWLALIVGAISGIAVIVVRKRRHRKQSRPTMQ